MLSSHSRCGTPISDRPAAGATLLSSTAPISGSPGQDPASSRNTIRPASCRPARPRTSTRSGISLSMCVRPRPEHGPHPENQAGGTEGSNPPRSASESGSRLNFATAGRVRLLIGCSLRPSSRAVVGERQRNLRFSVSCARRPPGKDTAPRPAPRAQGSRWRGRAPAAWHKATCQCRRAKEF